MTFGSRLQAGRQAYGPLCVGLDPHAEILQAWGLEDSVRGLENFAETVIDAFAGQVAFVKPQSAFFERFGARGVLILEWLLQEFRHTGTLTILDVKRGDIASTAAAYAAAYLDDDAPMAADAITVNPYLGFESLEPFFAQAEANDAGVFVLALTSNPRASQFQQARTDHGTVASEVLTGLAQRNADQPSMGPFGAVVGATVNSSGMNLDINGPLLVPGFGAQGGTVADVRRLFADVWENCVPTSSRSVLAVGPDPSALRAEAARVNAELVGS